ncbi:hypothetical protein [Limnobaculum parvum]|uniref:Uncharacterized protein n=1 Tax=Limnobaculum parvum TaxID=2172103 RepID=A0A2Y9TWD6_9GAMM|nr:hypothetical protein [Limnobaculum parvum]AWH88027.1 hypothetical protein HYN51_05305 [Limnobaculum parvum]
MYKGIFRNSELKTINESQSYWIISNEHGDNYYDLRDNIRPKYVVITEIKSPYHVCGADEDGYFGFGQPYKVYFLDEIPNDIYTTRYCYDGKAFTKFIDVEQWRYNELYWLKDQINDIEDVGGNASHLREYRQAVKSYSGDGVNPMPPIRP